MKKFIVFLMLITALGATDIAAVTYSGKLPVIFISTNDGKEITSKEIYSQATFYIKSMGIEGFSDLGSEAAQVELNIRGRGNYTWTGFNKKPYRLKFNIGMPVLGMNKNKHFALLAGADDELAFLRNAVGFELSRYFKMSYTPAMVPVELVFNGDYRGLYFLTEHIRVDKKRVNIVEQEDYQTDPYLATGGWLIEIDNYDEPEQVVITEGNGEKLRFTYHTPELLSNVQRNYLTNLVTKTDKAIYEQNKTSQEWEKYIDMDSLARFYIINEIVDNAESFHGSCYIHKELGNDTKLIFGPVWDFGNAFRRGRDNFIYINPPFGQSWIGKIAQFPRFQDTVKKIWNENHKDLLPSLNKYIDDFVEKIAPACITDAQRWNDYGNADYEQDKAKFKRYLDEKCRWLDERWWQEGGVEVNNVGRGVCVEKVTADGIITLSGAAEYVVAYDISGRAVPVDKLDDNIFKLLNGRGLYVLKVVDKSGNTLVSKISL